MGDKAKAEDLKKKGNEALGQDKIDKAVELYTEAIALDGSNHVLYSNRSAAYAKGERYAEALNDAEKAVELKSDWPKGYSRKGAALSYLGRYEEAALSYEEGLKLDPNNQQMKDGLLEAKRHLSGPAGSQPLRNPFMDPNLEAKLKHDPRTQAFLNQPDFQRILQSLKDDPKTLGNYLQDSRVMTALSVLLGVNLEAAGGEEEMVPPPKQQQPKTNSTHAKQKPATQKEEPMEEDISDAQKQALKEKDLGNTAYKKKNFAEAISHYDKAIELDSSNIVFRTNKAAVLFEQKEYDKCIEVCHSAVEVGRENRADYKLIAKALARIGNAYHKKNDLQKALQFYNKSLSEHRAPDAVKRAAEIEKMIKEREKEAYINPEISLEEKNKGNECFQKGDYPGAMKHYNEAVKRNPNDAKIFSNRAACYMKLMEFGMALKDCDEAIRLDPNFVKAYLRKGACLAAMKDTTKAGEVYQKAMELDPNCQEAIEGYKNTVYANNDPEAIRKRAMADPEIQQILSDPAMQLILQQMQKDPKALQEHLKNPDIAAKIQKLAESGLIAIR